MGFHGAKEPWRTAENKLMVQMRRPSPKINSPSAMINLKEKDGESSLKLLQYKIIAGMVIKTLKGRIKMAFNMGYFPVISVVGSSSRRWR